MLSVKPMLKKAFAAALVAVCAVSLFAGCQPINKPIEKPTENDYDIDGLYGVKIESKEGVDNATTSLFMKFDKATMTYEDYIQVGELSSVISKGTYEIDEAKDRVYTTAESGTKETFIIYGDYILAENFFYEGPAITGSIIKGEYYFTDSEGSQKAIGFDDKGKYRSGSVASLAPPNTGTYEVKGCVIYLNSDDEGAKVPFVIYTDTQITNSYYQKLK